MKNELLKVLTEEQIAKVKACENNEELLALAKAEGIELTDDQLAAANGGGCTASTPSTCPFCGSSNIHYYDQYVNQTKVSSHRRYACDNCHKFFVPCYDC